MSQCRDEILALARHNEDLIRLDTIGFGGEFGHPIWLVKLSDNPDATESEPALLFIGQVHAEEVIGVEIVLELMKQLIHNRNEASYRRRLEGLELYFIPTLNPDGFQVVHDDVDVTFRKNCRDNVGDGAFRYHRGLGRDSSGVDLNRNFGLHWDRGEALFFNNGFDDAYNYYRGTAPFSESETSALRDLMLTRRFLYSISYHSSRSGRNAELVIGPWSWEGKRPPGDDAIFSLATALANRIPRQEIQGTYTPVRATMRVGQEQDWAFQASGCMMYMIEAGADIQPDSASLEQVIGDNLPAAFYLMDLALGDTIPNGQGILTVVVRDSSTNNPLPAEVWLGPQPSALIAPLTCDPANGRFDRLVSTGVYELHVKHKGYQPFILDRCEIPIGGIVELNVNLPLIPVYNTTIIVIDDSTGESIPARLSLVGERGNIDNNYYIDGRRDIELSGGFHRILCRSEGYVPTWKNLSIMEISIDTIRLCQGSPLFVEDFDIEQDWQQGGMEGRWSTGSFLGRTCLTDSDTGSYPSSATPWLMIETGVELEIGYPAMLEIIHIPYFEPGSDFASVEAFDVRRGIWLPLVSFSCFPPVDWDTTYIDLTGLGLENSLTRLRFRIESDASVEEDGWHIDKLSLFYADNPLAVKPIEDSLMPSVSIAAFPSPANGPVAVVLELSTQTEGRLQLYNSIGQQVRRLHRGAFAAGTSRVRIDTDELSSGVYFIEFRGEGRFTGMVNTSSFLLIR